MLNSYRYMIRAWADIEILLMIFFLLFMSKGYGSAAGFVMIAAFWVAVVSLRKLRRMYRD